MSEEELGGLAFGLFFLLASLACLAMAWQRRVAGPHPWSVLDAILGLVSFVSVSGSVLLLIQATQGGAEPGFEVLMLSSAIGVLGSMVVVFLRASPEQLGLKRWSWLWVLAGAGMVVPFMGFTWGWVALVEVFLGEVGEQDIVEKVREGADSTQLQGILYGVLIAPIAEEILFRGFLLGALERASNTAIALLVSSLLFGLFHISDPITFVPLSVMGLCMGWLRLRSDSLWPAWAMHVGNNSTVLLLVVLAEA